MYPTYTNKLNKEEKDLIIFPTQLSPKGEEDLEMHLCTYNDLHINTDPELPTEATSWLYQLPAEGSLMTRLESESLLASSQSIE